METILSLNFFIRVVVVVCVCVRVHVCLLMHACGSQRLTVGIFLITLHLIV